ncbi:peptidase domain-containing ABC transporter [Staphylococcus schweitzeri]|uniref:peptidase domain-containing ABC transporter n=1 Tax=Staphylococcus schweitzeri TaxID=1654388 RepID=UPI000504F10F|nr:peptidase domain-containing ABC transporter [Staphylococcus schweitzeri]CDR52647.1 ABC-type bacteriocin transporter family protein [Staphylococcus schweitzeri]
MRVRFQQQSEHSECGLACVTMLIDFWKKKQSLSEMREKYGVPNGGYNLAQMQFILQQYGISSKAIKIKAESIKAVPVPFIVFWKSKHFIIVEKILSKNVIIIDPAIGKIKISYSEFKKNYSDISLYLTSERDKYFDLPKFNLTIKNIINSNINLFIKTFFIFLLAQCISICIPFIIRWLIDGEEKKIENIVVYTLILICAYFTVNIFRVRMITNLQIATDKELLSQTISKLLDLPYSYFTNRNNGELIYRINSNVYIREIFIDQLISAIVNVCFFIFYLIVMFILSMHLAIITIFITIFIMIVSIINTTILKKIAQNEVVVLTNSQGLISEMVNNIFTIKATNSQGYIFNKWSLNFEEQIYYEKKKAKYNSILANIPQMMQTFYTLIIYVFGYYLITKNYITLGSLIAFSTIGTSFLVPITSILSSYTQFQTIKVYLDRLLDILQTKKESSKFGDKNLEDFKGDISLHNVSYKYSLLSEEVISNISLKIKSGDRVAIVGASGSGKSTLLKVLAGLYLNSSGKVVYGKEDIRFLDIRKLRENIGVVLQENVVFNGSVKENIIMGRDYSEEQVIDILKKVDLYDYISSFPLGLETQISELGQNISGGQRQKISIARTIISNPKVIFLDEPTSSLDNLSEKAIMNHLFNIESTLVVVAHRLETIKNFDKIIVLDKGGVVGIGTHSELLNKNYVYQKLYKGD